MTRPRLPLTAAGDAGMYDAAEVRAYDRLMGRTPFRLIARGILREAARVAPDTRRGTLLDIACGPGHLLVGLATADPDLELHGLDISPAMLETAERNLARAGFAGRAILHLGSAYETGFPTGTFDLVVNTNALHSLDSIDPFFAEVVRILRPGGVAIVRAYRRDAPSWVRRLGTLHGRYRAWRRSPLKSGMGELIDASYTREEVEASVARIPSASCSVSTSFFGLDVAVTKAARY